MPQYEALRLRNLNPLSMIQKEGVYFLLRGNCDKVIENTILTTLHYIDTPTSLIPNIRKESIIEYGGLVNKIKDAELKDIIKDNILYLKEKGTLLQKSKEVAAAIGVNVVNFLFPFAFYRKHSIEY